MTDRFCLGKVNGKVGAKWLRRCDGASLRFGWDFLESRGLSPLVEAIELVRRRDQRYHLRLMCGKWSPSRHLRRSVAWQNATIAIPDPTRLDVHFDFDDFLNVVAPETQDAAFVHVATPFNVESTELHWAPGGPRASKADLQFYVDQFRFYWPASTIVVDATLHALRDGALDELEGAALGMNALHGRSADAWGEYPLETAQFARPSTSDRFKGTFRDAWSFVEAQRLASAELYRGDLER